MKSLLVALFLSVVLLGTAGARLGETKKECEKRYGSWKPKDEESLFSDPEKYYGYVVDKSFNGLDVALIFRKTDDICVWVTYIKNYKSPDDIEFTPEMVEDLLKRNYPDPQDLFVMTNSEGIIEGRPTGKKWMARWANQRNNDTALANCGQELEGEYIFALTCMSENYGKEMLDWVKNKDEILKQREREKTKKALQGL